MNRPLTTKERTQIIDAFMRHHKELGYRTAHLGETDEQIRAALEAKADGMLRVINDGLWKDMMEKMGLRV